MIELLYAMIPAYVANMAPVFARRLPGSARLDFGLTLRGRPLLGSHKTWKGLVAGTIAGTIAGIIVAELYWPIPVDPFEWSFLAAFGALAGDAIKSFFKRQMDIKSGKPWVPFDQVDFTIGALALGSFVYFPGWLSAAAIVAISALAHIAVNHAAFYLNIRGEKW